MTSSPGESQQRPLNLAEYYLLNCLDDSGKLQTQQHTVRVGLAGAVLTDLARRGCIYVTRDVVMVNSHNAAQLEQPLHTVLQIMTDAPENLDAEQWINRFSRPALLDTVIKVLEFREEIVVETKNSWGYFLALGWSRKNPMAAWTCMCVSERPSWGEIPLWMRPPGRWSSCCTPRIY